MNSLIFIVFASVLPLALLCALVTKLMIRDLKPEDSGKAE